ncbi:MMPL family transporter [[Mycobacterium] crassicus]|uniref:MMPL family transporter n=1 Tax=[Mycobacterium] crassicus TaxID=2872309 RepID=A0ABU5XEI3_9MYCO|nr:MMPL family transporter [Mycolicibacter sp. MYC098]MEB3020238.1 MMPL family transporter [Mycolicibacter sp. MYC098]
MMRFSSNLRRYRWVVFTGWLLAVIPSLYLAATQSGHLTGGGFEVEGSQSLHVQYQLEDHFPEQGASPLALVAAPRADATYQDMNNAVALLKQVAGGTPSVTVVPDRTQAAPRPDRPYVVSLRVDFNNTGAVDVAKKLRAKLGVEGEHPGRIENGSVNLYVIGQGALGAAASAKTKQDIAAAEQWNLPIVLIVLLAVFGSLAAAAIPLALGIATVIVTMGLVYLLSMFTTMSVFVTSTVSMFGIALAIDYSLFILMRYREELRAGRQPEDAVDAAMATSGLAVVLSGLTVVASLTGLYLINTPVLVSMATGAILAVSVAVLASVSLTPVVLALFGRAVAKRSSLLHWSRSAQTVQSRFWTRWTAWVMRRPWVSALVTAGFLLTLAAPALSLSLGNSMLHQFDSSHEIRGGVSAAAQALGPGALGPVRVLVTIPGAHASAPAHAATFAEIREEMTRAPNVASVSPPVFGDDNSSGLLSAVLSVDPEEMAARETVDWMREHLPAAAGSPSVRVDVGGPTALIKDFDDRVAAAEPLVLVFVALIAFLMLLISIRSVFLAFKGVVMTVLSVAAAYGSLVAVFQWGWLEQFGFAPTGSIDSFIPPIVLAMTFGLSMDYEIFLLTRIRERFLQSGNTHDAVAYGVSTSARTITSAALIMIAVFIGFAFAGMPLVAELGVACAVAIAVDATVVRLVLVPALMAMFDQWNWWLPRWLDWILPSVDFEKPLPRVELGDVVVIPDDISALITPSADLRVVVKSAAKLKDLVPDAVCVSDPLALRGCGLAEVSTSKIEALPVAAGSAPTGGTVVSHALAKLTGGWQARTGTGRALPRAVRPVHPVTVWRRRLAIALDALETEAWAANEIGLQGPVLARTRPMETAAVQLPTGDRLQIPTGAETLRLTGYLLMARNNRRDYAELAELVEVLDPQTVADALSGIDRYYSGQPAERQWMATQLVCRLAEPEPTDPDDELAGDSAPRAGTDWEQVRERCLSVAVAMLEEAR